VDLIYFKATVLGVLACFFLDIEFAAFETFFLYLMVLNWRKV